MIAKAASYSFFTLLLCSCAVPIRVRPLDRPLPTSEASGRPFKIQLGGRLGSHPQIELTPDLAKQAPSTASPSVRMTEDAALLGQIAVGPSIDVGIDFDLREFMLRGKFQLLGEPRNTASVDSFSLAVAGGFGTGRAQHNSSATSSSTSGSLSYDSESHSYEAAIVGGYRSMDWLLLFGGVSAKYTAFEGTFTSNTPAVGNGSFSGQGTSWGPYAGVEFGRRRFHYRMAFGLTSIATGNVRKNFFSSQGALSVTLGSLDN